MKNIHLWLDDDNAPFIDNLNTGTIIDMNLDEFFNYISWLGLEGTEDYENLSNIDITKKEQAYNQMQRFYNENCN